jgi:phosphoenolpyruvate carboxykinase (GTP)
MTTTNAALRDWVAEAARLTKPDRIVWCDGSDAQRDQLIADMLEDGDLLRLNPRDSPPTVTCTRSHPSGRRARSST